MKEAGETFDPKAYLPAITGYYSTAKGEMLSFPFNSSSMVMWVNKDALKKAGIADDPEDLAGGVRGRQEAEGRRLTTTAASPTPGRPGRIIEQFSAWHNVPIGTKANGLDGFDTELKFNTPLHVQASAEPRRAAEGQDLRLFRPHQRRARAASPRANARSS